MKMSMAYGKSKPENKKKQVECYHCGKKGHIKRDCRTLKREMAGEPSVSTDKKFAIMARTTTMNNSGWLVDSGASTHMTPDRNVLDNYKVLPKKVPIKVGNSEYVYGIGTGSVTVIATVDGEQIEVTISDVKHVPGISDNLFSAGMADEKGLKLLASGGRMEIIYKDNVIMVGYKAEGSNIYILDIQIPARACDAREARTEEGWHRVLGHPGITEIRNQRKGCTLGFKVVGGPTIEECGDCQTGKAHQVSHPPSNRERAVEVLERTHIDLVSPVNPTSLGGTRFFLLARDEFSTYLHAYFLASKAQVVDIIRRHINEASILTQKKVRTLRSDNGSEFRNAAMTQLCQAEGIIQEFSSPYTPQQNGEIERANRTIIESARAMIQASSLPLSLWGESVNTAVYLKNRLTNKRTGDQTPYEIFHGKRPEYSHLIEFGKQIHVLNKSSHLSKFEAKTTEAYLVGYGDRINTYRCFNAKKNDVMVSCDVFIAPHKTSESRENHQHVTSFEIESGLASHNVPRSEDDNDDEIAANNERAVAVAPVESRQEIEPPRPSAPHYPNLNTDASTAEHVTRTVAPVSQRSARYPDTVRTQCVPAPSNQPIHRRPNIILHAPQQRTVSTPTNTGVSRQVGALSPSRLLSRLRPAISNSVRGGPIDDLATHRNLSTTVECEPNSYDDALSCTDKDKWKIAICEELNAENGTWELVPKQAHMREITSKWIFKIKDDVENKRYKARLVARGFSQQEGRDYKDIFAPVVRMDSVRLLFSVAAQLNLNWRQFDITTAFLNVQGIALR